MVVVKKGGGFTLAPTRIWFLGRDVIAGRLGVHPHPNIILGGVVRHLKVGGLVPSTLSV